MELEKGSLGINVEEAERGDEENEMKNDEMKTGAVP